MRIGQLEPQHSRDCQLYPGTPGLPGVGASYESLQNTLIPIRKLAKPLQ